MWSWMLQYVCVIFVILFLCYFRPQDDNQVPTSMFFRRWDWLQTRWNTYGFFLLPSVFFSSKLLDLDQNVIIMFFPLSYRRLNQGYIVFVSFSWWMVILHSLLRQRHSHAVVFEVALTLSVINTVFILTVLCCHWQLVVLSSSCLMMSVRKPARTSEPSAQVSFVLFIYAQALFTTFAAAILSWRMLCCCQFSWATAALHREPSMRRYTDPQRLYWQSFGHCRPRTMKQFTVTFHEMHTYHGVGFGGHWRPFCLDSGTMMQTVQCELFFNCVI